MAGGARLNDEEIRASNEVWRGCNEEGAADNAALVTGQTVARMDLTDLERTDKRLNKERCV